MIKIWYRDGSMDKFKNKKKKVYTYRQTDRNFILYKNGELCRIVPLDATVCVYID